MSQQDRLPQVFKGRAVEGWPLGPSGLRRLRQGFIHADEFLGTENLALGIGSSKRHSCKPLFSGPASSKVQLNSGLLLAPAKLCYSCFVAFQRSTSQQSQPTLRREHMERIMKARPELTQGRGEKTNALSCISRQVLVCSPTVHAGSGIPHGGGGSTSLPICIQSR